MTRAEILIQKGSASVTAIVAGTEGDTVIAGEPTTDGIGYLVKHVACGLDRTDITSYIGKYAVDAARLVTALIRRSCVS